MTEAQQAVEVQEAAPERPEIRIQPVRSALVADLWERVEPMIRAAVAEGPGDETVADILERLARLDYQLWLVIEGNALKAAVVTTIAMWPRSKLCRIVYLGGEKLDAWAEALEAALDSWARQNGCDAIEFYGRRGWTKFAKQIGAVQVSTVWRKRL